ncbi:MAG: leucine-rich repeat protein [Bacteroidales bacterium]
MKKNFLFFSLLIPFVAFLTNVAIAQDTSTEDNPHTLIYSDVLMKGNTIVNYKSSYAHIKIPTSIGGVTVSAIGYAAFAGKGLKSIGTPPTSLEIVYAGAFADNPELTSVVLPERKIEYGVGVFENCGLTSITIPSTMTVIPPSFFKKNKFTSVRIPGTVIEISTNAFTENSSLEELILEEGIKYIGRDCFAFCEKLAEKKIKLPKSLINMGNAAFYLSGNNTYEIPEDNNLSVLPAYTYTKGEEQTGAAISKYKKENLRLIIMDNNAAIKDSARPELPDGYSWYHPQWGFVGPGNLAVPVEGYYYRKIANTLKYSRDETEPHTLDANDVEMVGGKIVAYYGLWKHIIIPAEIGGTTIDTIGTFAFYGASADSIEFAGDSKLEAILEAGLSNIGKGGADYIRGYIGKLPNSVNYIAPNAITANILGDTLDMTGLSIKSLGPWAMAYVPRTKVIKIPSSLIEITSSAFLGYNRLLEVIFPEDTKIQYINKEAFQRTKNEEGIPPLIITLPQSEENTPWYTVGSTNNEINKVTVAGVGTADYSVFRLPIIQEIKITYTDPYNYEGEGNGFVINDDKDHPLYGIIQGRTTSDIGTALTLPDITDKYEDAFWVTTPCDSSTKITEIPAETGVNVTLYLYIPLAKDDHGTILGHLGHSKIFSVLDNDVFPDNNTIISIQATGNYGKHGSAEIKDNKIVYSPNATSFGLDSIKYTIRNKGGCESSAVLYIGVSEVPDNLTDDKCTVSGQPEEFSWKIKKISSSGTDEQVSPKATALTGDIDNDGKVEILVTGKDSKSILIFEMSGNTMSLQQKLVTPLFKDISTPFTFAKVDGDDYAAIFLATSETADNPYKRALIKYGFNETEKKYEAENMVQYNPNTTEKFTGQPRIVDANGDGTAEVTIMDDVYNAKTLDLLLDGDYLPEYGTDMGFSSKKTSYLVVQDLDGDGYPGMAAGKSVYKVSITNPDGENGNTFSNWSNCSGEDIEGNTRTIADGPTAVADFNGDDQLDIVVSYKSGSTASFYIWDPITEKIIHTNSPDAGTAPPSVPIIGDINGDDKPDIILSGSNKLYAYTYNKDTKEIEELWSLTTTDPSGYTCGILFDFNQDGKAELVYQDQDCLYIINGEDGSIHSQIDCPAETSEEHPTVADVNGDGIAEIIVTSTKDSKPTVEVFSSTTGGSWAPARSVWNQFAANPLMINEDLTVPVFLMPSTATFSGEDGILNTDDDVRPFNNYLQQQTRLNTQGLPSRVAVDLEMVSLKKMGRLDSMDITLVIRNNSTDVNFLASDSAVAFYCGTVDKSNLFWVDSLPDINEAVDDATPTEIEYTFSVKTTDITCFNSKIIIVAGDKGKGVGVDIQRDCNIDNNKLEIEFQVDNGDAPISYGTNGEGSAAHIYQEGLQLGSTIDFDSDGHAVASGADNNGSNGDGEDEDAIYSLSPISKIAKSYSAYVSATNSIYDEAYIQAWFDWNMDGDFDDDEYTYTKIENSGDPQAVKLLWKRGFDNPDLILDTAYSYMRVRIAQDSLTSATGITGSGEVEDYRVMILPFKPWDARCGGKPFVENFGYASDELGAESIEMLAPVTTPFTFEPGSASDIGNTEYAISSLEEDHTENDTDGRALLVGLGTTNLEFYRISRIDIDPNTRYELSFYSKSSSADQTIDVLYAILDEFGNSVKSGTTAVGNDWQELSFTFSSNDLSAIQLVISGKGSQASNRLAIDDIKLHAFCDGGDLPDSGSGTEEGNYRTTAADSGAFHSQPQKNLYFGTVSPDKEGDGQSSINADGDDNNDNDDEDAYGMTGSNIFSATTDGYSYTLNLKATNETTSLGYIYSWIDNDKDGNLTDANRAGTTIIGTTTTEDCPLTHEITDLNNLLYKQVDTLYNRLRIGTVKNEVSISTNASINGEVEDHRVRYELWADYGNLPAPYITKYIDGGPYHLVKGSKEGSVNGELTLGRAVYVETDADETVTADNDAAYKTYIYNICKLGSKYSGNPYVENFTEKEAKLIAWIDFNNNKIFEESEAAVATVPIDHHGYVSIRWNSGSPSTPLLNDTVTASKVAVRLRISTDPKLTASYTGGMLYDGEVEDHFITIGDISGAISVKDRVICAGSGDSLGYVGSAGDLDWYKSSNGGTNWTKVHSNTSDEGNFEIPAEELVNNGTTQIEYQFKAEVFIEGCDRATTNTVTIKVDPSPNAGTVSPIDTTVCAGQNSKLVLKDYVQEILKWEYLTPGGLIWKEVTTGIGDLNDYTIPAELIANISASQKKYQFRAIVKSGVCSKNDTSEIASILVDPETVAGTLKPANVSVCNGEGANLILNDYVGTVMLQIYKDGAWLDITSTRTTSPFDIPAREIPNNSTKPVTYKVKAKVKSGECNELYSNEVDIIVFPSLNAGELYPGYTTTAKDTTIATCGDASAHIRLDNFVGTITRWESSTDNFATIASEIVNTNNTYETGYLAQDMYYRVLVNSGACGEAYSDTVHVKIDHWAEMGLANVSIESATDGLQFNLNIKNNSTTTDFAASTQAVAFYCGTAEAANLIHVGALPAVAKNTSATTSVIVPNSSIASCSDLITVVIVDKGEGIGVNTQGDCDYINNSKSLNVFADYGDLPSDYIGQTMLPSGAKHKLVGYNVTDSTASLMLGSKVSSETNGTNSADASADKHDDAFGTGADAPFIHLKDSVYKVDIQITNRLAKNANVFAWLDLNMDKIFDKSETVKVPVSAGYIGTTTLEWKGINTINVSEIAMRIRISTDNRLDSSYTAGILDDGEIEDYIVAISCDGIANNYYDTITDGLPITTTPLDSVYSKSSITLDSIKQPKNGTAVFNTDDNTVTYTPNRGFVGADSTLYYISANDLCIDSAWIIITTDCLPHTMSDLAMEVCLSDADYNINLLSYLPYSDLSDVSVWDETGTPIDNPEAYPVSSLKPDNTTVFTYYYEKAGFCVGSEPAKIYINSESRRGRTAVFGNKTIEVCGTYIKEGGYLLNSLMPYVSNGGAWGSATATGTSVDPNDYISGGVFDAQSFWNAVIADNGNEAPDKVSVTTPYTTGSGDSCAGANKTANITIDITKE